MPPTRPPSTSRPSSPSFPAATLPAAHRGADQPEYHAAVAAGGRAGRPEQLDPARLPDPRRRDPRSTFILGGWFDIFTYDELAIYRNLQLPVGQKQLFMGPTYHADMGYKLGGAGQPPRIDVLQKAWFDRWVKGIDNGIDRYGPVTLYQHGNGWTSTSDFPRPGMSYQRMYLSGRCSGTAPTAAHDGALTRAGSSSQRLTIAPV